MHRLTELITTKLTRTYCVDLDKATFLVYIGHKVLSKVSTSTSYGTEDSQFLFRKSCELNEDLARYHEEGEYKLTPSLFFDIRRHLISMDFLMKSYRSIPTLRGLKNA